MGFPFDCIRARALARLYAIHAITDEVYALLASKDRTRMSGRYLLSVEVICHSSWTAGATAGALAGTWLAALVGERIELLGFVLTSLFVVAGFVGGDCVRAIRFEIIRMNSTHEACRNE